MQLTLVVPGLAGVPDELRASVPALARLASRSTLAQLEVDLDAAIVMASGAPRETPVAPLAARGAGFDPGTAYTLRADPVAFVAGRDDVLLAGRVADLTGEEAHALVSGLNRHFAADGVVFHAPRADAWFATAREAVPVATHPLASIGGPIEPHLPEGDNGRIWRRWLSEMQMLLHDNAMNVQREASGLAQVTGIWISGGGAMPAALRVDTAIVAAPGYAGDVARGLALAAGAALAPTSAFRDLPGARSLVVTGAASDASMLSAIARDWLEPALAAQDRGELTHFAVIGDGGGRTLRWHAGRPSWWQRVRARAMRS